MKIDSWRRLCELRHRPVHPSDEKWRVSIFASLIGRSVVQHLTRLAQFEITVCDLKPGDTMIKKRALLPKPIESQILLVRGQKVLIDSDLAALYSVEVRALNQAVRRNKEPPARIIGPAF